MFVDRKNLFGFNISWKKIYFVFYIDWENLMVFSIRWRKYSCVFLSLGKSIGFEYRLGKLIVFAYLIGQIFLSIGWFDKCSTRTIFDFQIYWFGKFYLRRCTSGEYTNESLSNREVVKFMSGWVLMEVRCFHFQIFKKIYNAIEIFSNFSNMFYNSVIHTIILKPTEYNICII